VVQVGDLLGKGKSDRKVFDFMSNLKTQARAAGGDVLEIGAMDSESTLLRLPALRGARSRVGVNLDARQTACKDFPIIQADANRLTCFEIGRAS
jgi:hypothetical protein